MLVMERVTGRLGRAGAGGPGTVPIFADNLSGSAERKDWVAPPVAPGS